VNIFASIVKVFSFEKVDFYTVHLEGEEEDLFQQFIQNHEKEFVEDLEIIQLWLKNIGQRYGAREHLFRFEAYRGGDARALPPRTKFIEMETNLRLYCMRLDNQNVILFSGAIKTADRAQDCPQVRPHFYLANRISKAIDEALSVGEIYLDHAGKLVVEDNFTIQII
jgi:hypothetical protein